MKFYGFAGDNIVHDESIPNRWPLRNSDLPLNLRFALVVANIRVNTVPAENLAFREHDYSMFLPCAAFEYSSPEPIDHLNVFLSIELGIYSLYRRLRGKTRR